MPKEPIRDLITMMRENEEDSDDDSSENDSE